MPPNTEGRNYTNSLHSLSEKEAERTLPNSFYKALTTLIPKPDKDITRKLQTNISHDHRCKNSQQNISKLNPTMSKKKYTLQPSGFYLRYARLVQYSKVN